MIVALAATPVLSGCIAAAALPVLAAGGVVKSKADGRSSASVRDPQAAPAESIAQAVPTAGASGPVAAPLPEPDAAYRLTEFKELPAPGSIPGAPLATLAGIGGQYAAFADFASAKGAQPAIGTERHSAMLANSATMSVATQECSIQPAGVLIDLDPGEDSFDLNAAKPADPELASRLAALRDDGVIIGWISNRTADQAGMVRRALRQAGLDPDGSDELVLLRFPEERKQTRREDFAKSHCVVAIAGDRKADFDELFAYLRYPALALPLDKLIGAGWFLVPPPLATN